MEEARKGVDVQRDELKAETIEMEGEIEKERKEREAESKSIDELVRERDILNKNLVKMSGSTAQIADMLKINENTKRNLEVEISAYRYTSGQQATSIKRLQAEKARYAAESADAQSKFAQAVDEVKAREITVLQLQKKSAPPAVHGARPRHACARSPARASLTRVRPHRRARRQSPLSLIHI